MLASWKKSYDKSRQHIKKQRHYFADKGPSSHSYGFSSGHVWMWELDHKCCAEELMLFNCGVGEDSWESFGLQGDQTFQVNPKGNQSWIFIGRIDAEAETLILWPSDGKNWLIRKDPDAGEDWRQEEKGMTEVEMVGWHHQLDGHEFEHTLGVGDGQESLVCYTRGSQSWTWVSDWVNSPKCWNDPPTH